MPKANPFSMKRTPTKAIANEGLKLMMLPNSCFKIRPIGAEKSIIGTVPKPNKLIYMVDSITLGIAVAPIKAKYTNPQGISPLSNPNENATTVLSEDNNFPIVDFNLLRYRVLAFEENIFFFSPLGKTVVINRMLPAIRDMVFCEETKFNVLPTNPNTIPKSV